MASSGGSLPLSAIREVPARTVLSGPAGGVMGALAAARAAGYPQFLSYDMGGTSTDVALCHGAPALTQRSEIAGLPLKLPTLDIHTVGAGGGSRAWLDAGGVLRVGPQSLGADPGPACYGRQSPPYRPAVTDAHVVLGHIPAGTKLGGGLAVDADAARAALGTLAGPLGLGLEEAAQGVLRVAADERRARARPAGLRAAAVRRHGRPARGGASAAARHAAHPPAAAPGAAQRGRHAQRAAALPLCGVGAVGHRGRGP
jgi:N-methylhydantoinase A